MLHFLKSSLFSQGLSVFEFSSYTEGLKGHLYGDWDPMSFSDCYRPATELLTPSTFGF